MSLSAWNCQISTRFCNELHQGSAWTLNVGHKQLVIVAYSEKRFEPLHEKTNNLGFRPGSTKAGMDAGSLKFRI